MKTIQRLFFGFAVPAVAAIVMLAGLAACNRQDNRSASGSSSSRVQAQTASGGSSGGAQTQTASAKAAPESDFTVTFNSAGDGCVITKYTGPGGRIIIPVEIQGLPVREIGNSAFARCASLVSVIIPDSVTVIGGNVFENCTSLASVTIPDGITAINYQTFAGCESLASIAIPGSITKIGENAFASCKAFVSVVIPDSVTEIGEYAFGGCSSLENVTISLVAEREWRGSNQFKGCKLSLTAQKALRDKGYSGNF
jgi:hypothetical protein